MPTPARLLTLAALAAAILSACAQTPAPPSAGDRVTAAWANALAAARYSFDTSIEERTTPLPLLANAGARPRSSSARLSGHHDAAARRTDLSFSPTTAAAPLRLRIQDGRAFRLDPADRPLPLDAPRPDLAAPLDSLFFLDAARDVAFVAAERRPLPDGASLSLDHYRFSLDAAAYAERLRAALAARLRAEGAPAGVEPALPADLARADARGELWIDAAGFPRRISLEITLPPATHSRSTLLIRTDLHSFSPATHSTNPESTLRDLTGALLTNPPHEYGVGALAFFFIYASILGLRVRRLRPLWTALVLLGLLGGPLAQARRAQALHDWLAARSSPPAAPPPLRPADDPATDADADGLPTAFEARLGLDPARADSDGDGLSDAAETTTFTVGAVAWNADPLDFDADDDRAPDGLECPQRIDDARLPCADSDADGVPDLFDADSDGDGVDDAVDTARTWPLAPAGRFDDASPLSLIVSDAGSVPGRPLLVDFQLRPQNPAHLQQALNVLDWPADEQAQIRRKSGNDATFADLGGLAPQDANGDLRLIPLLEIEIPASTGYGNLPVLPNAPPASASNLEDWLDRSALDPYGVSVRYRDDAGNLVAYVPLQLVSDAHGGRRVAFSARMPYRPAGPAWGAAHSVRLVWAIQMLLDRCVPNPSGTVTTDPLTRCDDGAGTWSLNEKHIVHTYSEPWILTGLSAHEAHGASTLVIHENAARATPLSDSLWTLAAGLDRTFLDGSSTLTLSEIERRWNAGANADVSEDQRWGIAADALVTHRFTHTHGDEAARLAVSRTLRILDAGFAAYTGTVSGTVSGPVSGTVASLLFVREETGRTVDVQSGPDGGASIDGSRIQLSLAAAAPETIAGMSWAPYRRVSGVWQPFPIDEYLDQLSTDSRALIDAFDVAADDPERERILDGQAALLRAYYSGLFMGRTALVRVGAQSVPNPLRPSASDAAVRATFAAGGGAKATVAVLTEQMATFLPSLRGFASASAGRRIALALGAASAGVHDEIIAQLRSFQAGLARSPAQYGALSGLAAVAVVGAVAWIAVDGTFAAEGVLRVAMVGLQGYSVYAAGKALYDVTRGGVSLARTAVWMSRTSQVASTSQVLGAAVGIAVLWGMLAVAAASNQFTVGSLTGNALVASAWAQSITLLLMTAISLIPVAGQLIAAVVSLVDAVIGIVCWAAQSNAGWCGGVTGYVSSAVQWLIFSQNVMVDLQNPDRLRIGDVSQQLVHRSRGTSTGQSLATRLALTNTLDLIDWADADYDWKAGAYWWQYDEDTLRSSAFRYSLDADPRGGSAPTRNSMRSQWRGAAAPLSLRVELTGSAPISQAGLNRPAAPLFLHEGYAVPVQECWAVPAFLLPIAVPVCMVRTAQDVAHIPIGRATLLDVFPASLDEFLTLQPAGGSFRLAWDPRFPRLLDADGDGLRAAAAGGADPDDSRPDADGDGLDDFAELTIGGDPLASDADGDCLSDADERRLGTSPRLADSDADGLSDFAEAATPGAFCTTTGEFAGWDVVYGATPAGAPLALRVRSNPLDPNADGDAWLDGQERAFGFHPAVADGGPALRFSSSLFEDSQASDAVLRPGQSFLYSATVANALDSRSIRGVLEGSLPLSLSAAIAPRTFLLPPGAAASLEGTLTIHPSTADGPAQFLQEVRAEVFDWRTASRLSDVRLPFDEPAGAALFLDASGVLPASNAACVAPACPTSQIAGPRSAAVAFDGVDDALQIPAADAPPRRAELTIAAWVRPTTCAGCAQTLLHRAGDVELALDMAPGVRRIVVRRPGYAPLLSRELALSTDAWQHVAVALVERSGALSARFFVDGVAAGEDRAALSAAVPAWTPASLLIGRAPDGAFFRGALDDLHLFPHALDAGAVAALVHAPVFDQPGLFVDGVFGAPRRIFFTDPRFSLRGGAFTQAVWVYPRGASAGTPQPLALLLGDELPRLADGYPSLYQPTDDPNDVVVGFGDGCAWREFRFADVLAFSRWNHLAVTYDAAAAGPARGRYSLYVDGVAVGSADRDGSACFGVDYPPTPAAKFLISVAPRPDGASAPVVGMLHSPIIHARALGAADVAALFRSASAAFVLALDDAPGADLFRDESQSTVALCSPPACPTAGILGRIDDAASFDGDDVLRIRAAVPATEFALALWFRTTAADPGALFATEHGIALSLTNGALCSASGLCAAAAALTDGAWHHLVHTAGPSIGGERIYVDGALLSPPPLPEGEGAGGGESPSPQGFRASAPTSPHPSPSEIRSGEGAGGGVLIGPGFRGALDDVRLLRRAFTPADVADALQRAPRLRLRFNEPAGATAFADDAGGPPALCTAAYCPRAGFTGRAGHALRFAGGSGVTLTAPSPALAHYTLEAWVRPAQLDAEATVLGRADGPLALVLLPDGAVAFRARSAADAPLALTTTAGLVLPDQWSHLALAFDGAQARLFVNGAPHASAPAPLGQSFPLPAQLALGAAFFGAVDEVRLYSYARLDAEIAQHVRRELARIEESAHFDFTVDGAPPRSSIPAGGAFVAPGPLSLVVPAHDDQTSVASVEIGVNGVFTAASACDESAQAWCLIVDLPAAGEYRVESRAVDRAGNVEPARPPVVLTVDAAAPLLTTAVAPGADLTATPHADGFWTFALHGAAQDAGSGLAAVSVELLDAAGARLAHAPAAVTGTAWSLDLPLAERAPNGFFTLRIHAVDHVGNAAALERAVRIDAVAPTAAAAGAFAPDTGAPLPSSGVQQRSAVTDAAQVLTGVVVDPAPGVGVASVEAALVLDMPGLPGADDPPGPAALAYLPLDDLPERSGRLAFRDVVGARTAGCVRGACPQAGADGFLGNAAAFDGRTQGVELAGLSVPASGSTVLLWMRTTAATTVTLAALSSAASPAEQSLYLDPAGRLCASFRGAAACRLGALNDGAWRHVALVAAAGAAPHLYVDGVRTSLTTLSPAFSPATTVTLGSGGSVDLDEVRIAGAALSDGQVAAAHAAAAQAHDAWLAARTPTWVPAARGPNDTWRVNGLFAGRQGHYRLDLRTTDRLGNARTQPGVWSGMVDTVPPALSLVVYYDFLWQPPQLVFHAADVHLDPTRLRTPCGDDFRPAQTFFDAGWHRIFAGDGLRPVVGLHGACLSAGASPSTDAFEATACDVYGNCSTAAIPFSAIQISPERPAQPAAPVAPVAASGVVTQVVARTDVVQIAAPPADHVVTALQPVPLTLTAAALDQVRAITLFVDGAPVAAQHFAAAGVTWTTAFTPSAAGAFALTAALRTGAGRTTVTAFTHTLLVDLAAPAPTIDAVVTGAASTAAGVVDFSGTIADDVGVRALTVTIDGAPAPAAITPDGRWRAAWSGGAGDLPDGRAFSVTVHAVDAAGRPAAAAATVLVDVSPPQPVELRLAPTVTGAAQLTWTAAVDGGGPVRYEVRWQLVDELAGFAQDAPPREESSASLFVPSAPGAVRARLGLHDPHGNVRWQAVDQPLIVDDRLTPDYAPLRDLSGRAVDDWRSSGCSLLDVDRRPTAAGRPAEQRLYATWNAHTLRLAFEGADWDVDGALSLYLSPLPSPLTPNSYPLTPTLLIHIPNNARAELRRWDGTNWALVRVLTADEFAFDGARQGSTDLAIPFAALGIDAPAATPFTLRAVASEDEDGRSVWSAFPVENPLTAGPAASDGPVSGPVSGTAALPFHYAWPAAAAGVCPNGNPSATEPYGDAALDLAVSAEPAGAALRLIGDRLALRLTGDESPAERAAIAPIQSAPAPVAAGTAVRYAFTLTNAGPAPLHGLRLAVSATNLTIFTPTIQSCENGIRETHHSHPLRGWEWCVSREFSVPPDFSLAPGAQRVVVLTGVVGADAEFATLAVHVLADGRPQPLLETAWVDHRRDLDAPADFGFAQAGDVRPSGRSQWYGYAHDPSGVPLLEFEISGPGRTTTTTCADPTPADGQWSCPLDLFRPSVGDALDVRVRATDGAGHASAWSAPRRVYIDDGPPAVDAYAADQAVRSAFQIAGAITDDVGIDALELCVDARRLTDCLTLRSADVTAGQFVTAGVWFGDLLLPLVDGERFTVTTVALDLAGNRSAPARLHLTADAVAAPFDALQIARAAAVFDSVEVLRGVPLTDLRQVVVTVRDPRGIDSAHVAALAADGAWSFFFTPTQPGLYEFRVQGLDRHGNPASRGPYTLSVRDARARYFPLSSAQR